MFRIHCSRVSRLIYEVDRHLLLGLYVYFKISRDSAHVIRKRNFT